MFGHKWPHFCLIWGGSGHTRGTTVCVGVSCIDADEFLREMPPFAVALALGGEAALEQVWIQNWPDVAPGSAIVSELIHAVTAFAAQVGICRHDLGRRTRI